jgi:Ca2+-binding EF-hand superfamily protein
MFVERDIEAAKIDMALRPDFNLVDAFKMFDIKSLGGICKQDFMDGLRANLNFNDYTPDDVQLMFKRFDKGLGHINFNGFGDAILPLTQEF